MDAVTFQLPFNDYWLAFWGGDTPEQNQHHATQSQKHAFDFIQTDKNGKFFKSSGETNEDYYSFGADVLAPAEGEVIETVDGMRDNQPGELNSFHFLGNYVMLKHSEGVYSILGHLRQNSITVKAGQKLLAGQRLGECGNSGYSTDSHLHFHVQDSATFAKAGPNYERVDIAQGVKVFFAKVARQVNDTEDVVENYSPVKGDKVSNAK